MLCFVVLNHLGWHSVDKGDHRLSKHIHSVLDWSNVSNVINLFVTGLWDPDSNRREKSKPFLTDTNLTTVWFTWHASGVLFRVECLSRLRKVSWECQVRQTGRNRDNGRNWDAVGYLVTHEQKHTCQSKMDVHALTRGTHNQEMATLKSVSQMLLVSTYSHLVKWNQWAWCGAVLNFKGHLRRSKPKRTYRRRLTQSCTCMNSWLYSSALTQKLVPTW